MRQLALQIQSDAPPTLANFVTGRNAEALAALRATVTRPARETLIYLWGPEGSGKSHLLQALGAALEGAGIPALRIEGGCAVPADLDHSRLLVDAVERLTPALAERLFHAWNRIREEGGLLVCAGSQAPAALPLAPELASRLAWGAVYRLQALDDEEKWAALRARADEQGIPVADEALRYLLAHARRDLPSLLTTLAQLDAFSLESQRAITLPVIRDWLQRSSGQAGAGSHPAGKNTLEPLCD